MNYNRVTLAGNLTRDPELKYLPNGTAVCRIGLAINREWKDQSGEKKSEVVFVDVDFFGKTAENVSKYFKKGRPIFIEGRLKLDTWTDKQTNQPRSKLGVIAESFQFVDSKSSQASEPPASRPTQQALPASAPTAENKPEEDDVPF